MSDEEDERELCKYGEKCYRKNKDHLQRFAHPWKEQKSSPNSAKGSPRADDDANDEQASNVSVSPSKKSAKKSAASGAKKAVATQDGESVLRYVQLGTSAWQYRSRRARYFNSREDGEEDDVLEELLEAKPPVYLSRVRNGELLTRLKSQLQHGDVIDFHTYRGCGCFVVEPVDATCRDFILYKTLEEMGYSLPLLFSDAPVGYYEDTPVSYTFRHCDFVSRDDKAFWDEVAARRANPKYDATADWADEIVAKDFPAKYVRFFDAINGGDSWVQLSSYLQQDYCGPESMKLWRSRRKFHQEHEIRVAKAVCEIVFRKTVPALPKVVAHLIGEYVCRAPFGVSKRTGGKSVTKKSTTKRRKKGDDDDEWND